MLDPDYTKFDYVYINLGAGVQSTALYLLACAEQRGVPKAEVAIFADTQDEPAWVYENLDRLRALGGIPIEVVSAGCLGDDLMHKRGAAEGERFAWIPAFTLLPDGRAGPLRRQCTRDYKITPIEKKVRTLMGYKPRQVIKEKAASLVGISLDEVQRAKDSRTRWVETCFPLIDARMDRHACLTVIAASGLPAPLKSSCIFCPYHSDSFWKWLKDNYAAEWARACKVDAQIRDMTRAGVERPAFLHGSLAPLADVHFDDQGELFDSQHGVCDEYCNT